MLTIRRISISIAADPASAHLRHKLGARLVLRLLAGRIEPRRQGRHDSALQRLAAEQRDFGERLAPIGKEVEIDVILGKALRALPETKLLKPVRNLLHCGPQRILRYPIWTGGNDSLAHARASCSSRRSDYRISGDSR